MNIAHQHRNFRLLLQQFLQIVWIVVIIEVAAAARLSVVQQAIAGSFGQVVSDGGVMLDDILEILPVQLQQPHIRRTANCGRPGDGPQQRNFAEEVAGL